jgi:hypothetical protein
LSMSRVRRAWWSVHDRDQGQLLTP